MKKLLMASAALLATCSAAVADEHSPRSHSCQALNAYVASQSTGLKSALQAAVANTAVNGGFGLNMWATLVANDGTVCAVVHSGASYQDQWLASRVISAQKASTANSLSLSNGGPPSTAATGGQGFALSTANLYARQPLRPPIQQSRRSRRRL
jgi:hypothetical protein